LPQGQSTVSVGLFFSNGFRQTGQFFCHMVFVYTFGPFAAGPKQIEIGAG
jgi:hypothetical protein